ncbi:MAG: hypothetical protein AAGA23_03005 [Pseudomonadota bacterium]
MEAIRKQAVRRNAWLVLTVSALSIWTIDLAKVSRGDTDIARLLSAAQTSVHAADERG